MVQNSQTLAKVWQNLSAGIAGDKGSIFAFVSPQSGNGTSYIVREMALLAAKQAQTSQSKPVLVIDMDIQNSAQAEYFFSNNAISEFGTPNGPYDASFGKRGFWRIIPSVVGEDGQVLTDSHFMSLHILPNLPLGFSNFHWEKFMRGQSVQIAEASDYWQALRQNFSAIFVDLPALDRSDILKTISPEADQNILITNPDHANLRPIGDLYAKLKAMNAKCAGMIINELPRSGALYGGNI